MKKIVISLCLLLSFIFTACSQKSTDEKKVREVAEKYLTAFKNMDFQEAEKYGTKNAKHFLNLMEKEIGQWTPEERAINKERVEKAKIEILNVKLKDEANATVSYKFIEENQPRDIETLFLVKKGKEWKVEEYPE